MTPYGLFYIADIPDLRLLVSNANAGTTHKTSHAQVITPFSRHKLNFARPRPRPIIVAFVSLFLTNHQRKYNTQNLESQHYATNITEQ
jgi:hypothetical protein